MAIINISQISVKLIDRQTERERVQISKDSNTPKSICINFWCLKKTAENTIHTIKLTGKA